MTVVPVTKGAQNGQDPVSAYTVFLKASNTPDGPANYTQGVDWTQSPNVQMDILTGHWVHLINLLPVAHIM